MKQIKVCQHCGETGVKIENQIIKSADAKNSKRIMIEFEHAQYCANPYCGNLQYGYIETIGFK